MATARRLHWLLAIILLAASIFPASAKSVPYQTGFDRWRAADDDFTGWLLDGTIVDGNGTLALDPAAAKPGSDPDVPGGYYGRNYYNGGSFLVGSALGPEIATAFNYQEAIASWNAETPPRSWIEVNLRLSFDSRWSKWYVMGIWAADNSTIERHSVRLQGDADAFVSIDTLVVDNKKAQPDGYQVLVKFFSEDGLAIPLVRNLSVAYSTTPPAKVVTSAGNPAYWNTLTTVPECSQMVYPDGGEVWCSPTSTAMTVKYWQQDTGACEPDVRAAVASVYDWLYDGHGNWPFNTAFAATRSAFNDSARLEGYVARFTSMDQIEPWVAAGVPIIASIAWKKNGLEGAPIPRSGGHLLVIVGFDGQGNPIVNDPAAASDAEVTRSYLRGDLESAWLTASGGTVYLIYPPGHSVPGL